MTIRLGVDIGGTGVKAAPVDLERGALVGDRRYVATPHPATLGNGAGIVGAVMAVREPAVWRPADRTDEGVN